MEIFTIGSSGISAEKFFTILKDREITAIVDTRVHPSSQLAGFTKGDSLRYFAQQILEIPYIHEPFLCPESEDLKLYRSHEIEWSDYEISYLKLLGSRNLESSLNRSNWGVKPVLLCSEKTERFCHRRLAADFLSSMWSDVTTVRHL